MKSQVGAGLDASYILHAEETIPTKEKKRIKKKIGKKRDDTSREIICYTQDPRKSR